MVMNEKAILVTAFFDSMRRPTALAEASDELKELSQAIGLEVVENLSVKQKKPNAPLFLGQGRVEEIRAMARAQKADVVVFESDLSSSQQRNLEEIVGVKTIDRTQLILDIFARRARSTEGKLQVELAQMKYMLPRLAGKGIYLSRLGGGVGTRGPGEQKLEVDRRRIREKITRLTRELAELKKRRVMNLERKQEKNHFIVALVGYTNAGKSTLFNRLTGSQTLVKNQLFSTLDTTTRSFLVRDKQEALLVDTVGFIRDLPHHLVESFKATLEEVAQADLLLHVADAARSDWEGLEKSVQRVLEELGVDQKKRILVLNKSDALSEIRQLDLMRQNWKDGVLVSAKTGEGLVHLKERISQYISKKRHISKIFIPQNQLNLLPFLYENSQVFSRKDLMGGVELEVEIEAMAEEMLFSRLKAKRET